MDLRHPGSLSREIPARNSARKLHVCAVIFTNTWCACRVGQGIAIGRGPKRSVMVGCDGRAVSEFNLSLSGVVSSDRPVDSFFSPPFPSYLASERCEVLGFFLEDRFRFESCEGASDSASGIGIDIKRKGLAGGEEQPKKGSEMQAAVQAGGGPSSSPLSGHDSSKQQQFKCDSEHPPCTAYSASGKTKKRDRSSHHSVDSSERDRSVKADDIDPKRLKRERNGNSSRIEDIGNIVDHSGGLFSFAGVERLYLLMQHHHDQNENSRKAAANSVAYRNQLAGVIAATDREDCLNRFAQLGGLCLLDDWLQEAHKGKVGDLKEGDKNMEELLLTLLRAFEKLPVDWDALKSCNAGRSVNHLRNHKNSEIQKKAKKLVENWKKKVGAEKKQSGETKSGSIQGMGWPGKPVMLVDSSHVLKSGGGSVDGVAKSSEAFVSPVKANGNNNAALGEVLTKPVPVSLGKFASGFSCSPGPIKENPANNMLSSSSPPADIGGASVPDERSSNNQPLGNGLMWSNGPPSKNAGSNWKEDMKSPGNNVCANAKTGSSRPHLSGKGVLGAGLNGSSCKELGSGKPLVWNRSGSAAATVGMEKSSSMSVTSDKSANESSKMETSSSQRLIVRLPNPGRSPVPNSVADLQASTSRASPPERHSSLGMDSFDGKSRSQTASCIDDAKAAGNIKAGGVPGPDEIGKPADLPERGGDDETVVQCRTGEVECHSSESQLSFSSTHFCVAQPKESPTHRQGQAMHPRRPEKDSTMPNSEKCSGQGTDAENGGISLLACVAADEGSRSEKDAEFGALGKNNHATDGDSLDKATCLTDLTKPRQVISAMGDDQVDRDAKDVGHAAQFRGPSSVDGIQHSGIAAAAAMGQSDESMRTAEEFSSEHRSFEKGMEASDLPQEEKILRDSRNLASNCPSSKSVGDTNREEGEFNPDSSGDAHLEIARRDALDDKKHALARSKRSTADVSFAVVASERYGSSGEDVNGREEKDDGTKMAMEATFRLPGEDALEVAMQVAKEVEQEMATYGKNTPERENQEANTSPEKVVISKDHLESHLAKEQKQKPMECSNDTERVHSGSQAQNHGSSRRLNSISHAKEEGNTDQFEFKETDQGPTYPSNRQQEHSNSGSEALDGGRDEANKAKRAVAEQRHTSPTSWPSPNMICSQASSPEVLVSPKSFRSRASTPEQTAEVTSNADAEAQERHDFDLNEGIVLDESQQEATTMCYPVAPIPVIPVATHSLASSSVSAPIAVVASTKGAFMPPVSPLQGKGHLGWKGSAATSAFRPAEPRRTPDRNPDRYQTAAETDVTCPSSTKPDRPLFDFDLNVADEGLLLEETVPPVSLPAQNSSVTTSCNGHSGARLDLDLNRADESEENGTVLASDLRKIEALSFSTRGNGSSVGAKPIKHDFDLNDGLNMDDAAPAGEPIASTGNLRMLGNAAPSLAGFKMGGEMISITPWSHTGAPFSAVAMPAFATVRPETPFSMAAVPQTFFSVGQAGIPYHSDLYRPPAAFVSSASATYPYPTQSPVFPYPGFHIGFGSASFPAVSTSFPAVSASFLDSSGSQSFPPGASPILTSGAILPSHARPSYLMGLTKITTPSNIDRNLSRHNLDLNAGPELVDAEAKDERAVTRQAPVFGGPPSLDEPLRAFRHSVEAVDSLKRKEPEGGWDIYRSGLKQETWR